MNPKVIFDVNQVGYQSWFLPCVGLVFFLVGMILAIINYLRKKIDLPPISDGAGTPRPLAPMVLMGFSVLWFLATFWITYQSYRHLGDALSQGRCQVIEGQIQHYHAGSGDRGDANDSFDLNGLQFSYSDTGLGFSQTQVRGGPLKEGLRVKIYAFQGDIARLEILP